MSDSALDPAVLEALRHLNQPGEPDVVAEVLTLFRDVASARVAAIASAIERRDGQALQHAAHDLKGASATIGAWRLQQCCRELEERGRAGVLDELADLHTALQREYAAVAAAIERCLDVA